MQNMMMDQNNGNPDGYSEYSTGQLPVNQFSQEEPEMPSVSMDFGPSGEANMDQEQFTRSVLEQTSNILDEKISLLVKFNQSMEKSLRDLQNLKEDRYTHKTITRSYEWNKASMDIKDWQRFQKDNEVLIKNLQRKSMHQMKKALTAQMVQQVQEEEEA